MISLTMPKTGRIRMYTSGWPKNQKMCCHSSAEPPFCTSKKCAPRLRASSTIARPAVSGGKATRICTEVQTIVHTKNGTLCSAMPGAHAEDGGDEVEGGGGRADAADDQAQRPQIGGGGAGEGPLGQGRI